MSKKSEANMQPFDPSQGRKDKKVSLIQVSRMVQKRIGKTKSDTSFKYKDWQFDIDQYPEMPAYLEIEGVSDEHVREAMRLLGIENNATWAKGERILIQDTYGLDWYHMNF